MRVVACDSRLARAVTVAQPRRVSVTARPLSSRGSSGAVDRTLGVRFGDNDAAQTRVHSVCSAADDDEPPTPGEQDPPLKRSDSASVRSQQGGEAHGLHGGAGDAHTPGSPQVGGEGLSASYPSQPGSVAAIRAAVVDFAARHGACAATLDAVRLAVSEAATNVVVHAYRDAPDRGVIELAVSIAGGELWVIVSDGGSGLRARRDSPGLGLGLGLIAGVADGIDLVQRAGGGLELRMRFALDAPGLGTQ